MTAPLRILHLEDNRNDAELAQAALEADGLACAVTRVDTRADFLAAVERGGFDLILADYSLPGYDGLSALGLVREQRPEVPFILVSGTVGEEVAVDSLKHGATDYVLKQRLSRLVPAVRRALRETEERAERRRAEQKYQSIFENAVEGMFLSTPDGRFINVNPAMARIYGYDSPQDMVDSIADISRQIYVDPDERGQFIRRLQTHGVVDNLEGRNYRKDGAVIWTSTSARAVRDAVGNTLYYEGFLQDITERKRAEEALKNSEKRFRALIENGLDNISLLAADGALVWESPAVVRTLGYDPDDFLGRDIFELMHPDDLNWVRNLFAELIREPAGRRHSSFQLRHSDGTWRWVEAVATNLLHEPSVEAIVINYRDITERKRAEAAVLESESQMRALVTSLDDIVFEFDEEGTYLNVWTSNESLLALPKAEMLRRRIVEMLGEENGRPLAEAVKRVLASGQAENIEYPLEVVGGQRWFQARTSPILTADGHSRTAVMLVRDITRRKQAEQALREAEQQLRLVVNNAPITIFATDAQGVFTLSEGKSLQTVGLKPGENVGVSAFDLYRSLPVVEDTGAVTTGEAVIRRVLAGETITGITELRGVYFQNQFVPLRDANAQVIGLIGVANDITGRKQAEEALKHRLAELEAVNQVSTALRAAQTLDEMLPRLIDATLSVLGTDAGALWLYDEGRDVVSEAVSRGWLGVLTLSPAQRGEGIAGQVLATGEVYLSREFAADPRTRESVRAQVQPGWGGACVPIRSAQGIVGVFFVSVPLPRELTPNEVNLLTTLCEIAGNAIQRTVLHQQTEQRLQHIAALHAIDSAISGSLDLRVTLNVLLDQVRTQLGVDAADVLLFNPGAQMLEYAAGRGFRSNVYSRAQVRLGDGQAGKAALERQIVAHPDFRVNQPSFALPEVMAGEGFAAYYAMPLIAKGEIKGVLEILHRAPLTPDPEWLSFLETLAGQAAIAIENAALFDSLQRSNTELALAYDSTIEGWSRALDLRDRETEGHTRRVTDMTIQLARAFGLGDDDLAQVRWGALLHDIGKMGVPDSILLKPGPLTEDEWVAMKQHPTFAYEMLSPIRYLRLALDIPYRHHEKWDGTGYPMGLKGEQIPLTARIFAVVDVWDALNSDRPYRAAWPEDKVREHLRSLAGTHFDPQVVKVCLESEVLVSHQRE